MYNFFDESMIREKMKRVRLPEVENEEIEDMPNDLPESVLLHILSFFDVKYATQLVFCPREGSVFGNLFKLLFCILQDFPLLQNLPNSCQIF